MAQRRWQDKLGDHAPYITFNLSARQLSDENLVANFLDILSATNADPKRLVIEVTETSIMADIVSNQKILEELKGTGMSVAVDDFGTGYSSLAQLLRLNVDTLKIDRMFIDGIEKNPDNQAVVAAICRMAKAFEAETGRGGNRDRGSEGYHGLIGVQFKSRLPLPQTLARKNTFGYHR